ncbi:MAG: hypothetical protein EZS26_000947 [Candidatus Ordinivivax streblomastigis]|uniref:DUF1735 domain-containing protein n=1 Tax=Candidatus Ordinivivax streblomastigis TaxID=2540710 RepID=A0A5M8P2R7_9BACT|nr:MAG: hypothetical protein EZS26_000947 [Candidatus Ordinivivax streblomastigis]
MKSIINKIAFALLAGSFFITSCDDVNVLKNEQYIKQVYIIGASDVVWTFDVSYSDEPQNAYISIATGGSKNINTDVNVKLRYNETAIDWYNNKYMFDAPAPYRRLDPAKINIPSMETTIQAGAVYSRLPFTIQTDGLHCDSLYSVAFEIESVSEYEVNKKDSVLILNFNLTNEYAGVYQLSASRSTINSESIAVPDGSLSVSRTLKAVDAKSVRFFNEAKAETRSGYASNEAYFEAVKAYCVQFVKKAGDNNSFDIKPWDGFEIIDGNCTYADGRFTFWYDYSDGTIHYRIEGTLVK